MKNEDGPVYCIFYPSLGRISHDPHNLHMGGKGGAKYAVRKKGRENYSHVALCDARFRILTFRNTSNEYWNISKFMEFSVIF